MAVSRLSKTPIGHASPGAAEGSQRFTQSLTEFNSRFLLLFTRCSVLSVSSCSVPKLFHCVLLWYSELLQTSVGVFSRILRLVCRATRSFELTEPQLRPAALTASPPGGLAAALGPEVVNGRDQ